jgi:integral membrane sensor domain MASE1
VIKGGKMAESELKEINNLERIAVIIGVLLVIVGFLSILGGFAFEFYGGIIVISGIFSLFGGILLIYFIKVICIIARNLIQPKAGKTLSSGNRNSEKTRKFVEAVEKAKLDKGEDWKETD